MRLNFYLPKYLTGGGELILIQLLKSISRDHPGISMFLFCQNSDAIKVLDKKILNEINYQNKLQLIIKLVKNFMAGLIRTKDTRHISTLSGMIIITGLINLFFWQKLICIEHSNLGKFYFQEGNRLKKVLRVFLYNLALLKVDTLIFVSEVAKKDSILKLWSINHKKVSVLHNPIVDIGTKLNLTKNVNKSVTQFLIIGRFSPEKRIETGLKFLKKNNMNNKIILVSNVNSEFQKRYSNDLNIVFYADYSEVPNLSLSNTLLLNFGLVESFSLVIGEWLKAGGRVFSVNGSSCNPIWISSRGFYEFDENLDFKKQISRMEKIDKKDNRPIFIGENFKDYKDKFLNIVAF